MKKVFVFAGICALSFGEMSAQVNVNGQTNIITTAVPFLRITPDARSAGMGDVGIATTADANSQYWNVGKLPFAEKKSGISLTYTPWLKAMTPDMSLIYLSGYTKLGKDNDQAISGSLRYFSLGNLKFSDMSGNAAGSSRPREFSLDLGYSRRLSNSFAMGVSLRYIRSAVMTGTITPGVHADPGNAVAADLGVFYTKKHQAADAKNTTLSLGAVISNIGSKMKYNGMEKGFLPANLGLGAAYTIEAEDHQFTFGLDINKLLVPTPRDSSTTATPKYYIPEKSVVSGMFSSFGDAPDGFNEELKEFQISLGVEYWFRKQFAARVGYSHENKLKGNRQYLTFGLGVNYKVIQINGAYLVPTSNTVMRNPLANTFRIGIGVAFDNLQKPKTPPAPASME